MACWQRLKIIYCLLPPNKHFQYSENNILHLICCRNLHVRLFTCAAEGPVVLFKFGFLFDFSVKFSSLLTESGVLLNCLFLYFCQICFWALLVTILVPYLFLWTRLTLNYLSLAHGTLVRIMFFVHFCHSLPSVCSD